MSDRISSFRTAVAESNYTGTRWGATETKFAVRRIAAPSADLDAQRRQAFLQLVAQWRHDTNFMSSPSAIVEHPAYQSVIGLGVPAISLILRELEREPDFWFEALRKITGENPVPQEDHGDMYRMTQAWLDWGAKNGYR
jgi:hypothetical protein